MANFITSAELQTAIGDDAYQGITDSATAGVITMLLSLADARVLSALRRSGYGSISVATLSGYSTEDQYAVKSMAIAVAATIGCARRGFDMASLAPAWILPKDFDVMDVRLPNTVPDFTGAPGGIQIGDSGTQSDTAASRGTTLGMDKTGGYP